MVKAQQAAAMIVQSNLGFAIIFPLPIGERVRRHCWRGKRAYCSLTFVNLDSVPCTSCGPPLVARIERPLAGRWGDLRCGRFSRSHRPDGAGGWIVCVSRTWAASAHGVRGLHAPRRGHLDAGEQRQALRESFSVTRSVPRPATPHDYRLLDRRVGACSVARFAQPERKIVQARGETRLIMSWAAVRQAAIGIDRLAARLPRALPVAPL